MRSTFLGFETARRGLAANQKGLDITGQNMTNVHTQGYTRQRLDLVSLSGSHRDRVRSMSGANAGQGVSVVGVSQIRNAYLDSRFRNEIANTAYFESSLAILNSTEAVLNEVNSGFKPYLSGLVSTLQSFANNPDQTTHANMVRTSTKSFVDMFNHVSNQLHQVQTQYVSDLKIEVNELNQHIQKIQHLNQSITAQMMHDPQGVNTTAVNELLDQRNVIVDELAQFLNITVKDEVGGSIAIYVNDHPIISSEISEQVNLFTQPDGSVRLTWQSSGQPLSLSAGSLKANLDFINGATGVNKGVVYYREQIQTLAKTFSEVMNQAFLKDDGSHKSLLQFDPITSLMRLSDEFELNPRYIISEGVNQSILDNTHIHALIQRLEGPLDFDGFKGSMSDFIEQYSVTLAQDINFLDTRLNVSLAVVHDIEQHRDSISGVSLDEEGAELMKYEKAYKAMARLMTTMDEALDTIINRTGLVGR